MLVQRRNVCAWEFATESANMARAVKRGLYKFLKLATKFKKTRRAHMAARSAIYHSYQPQVPEPASLLNK
jgi:hypothetical protein